MRSVPIHALKRSAKCKIWFYAPLHSSPTSSPSSSLPIFMCIFSQLRVFSYIYSYHLLAMLMHWVLRTGHTSAPKCWVSFIFPTIDFQYLDAEPNFFFTIKFHRKRHTYIIPYTLYLYILHILLSVMLHVKRYFIWRAWSMPWCCFDQGRETNVHYQYCFLPFVAFFQRRYWWLTHTGISGRAMSKLVKLE